MLCWGLFGLNIITFNLDLITSYFIAKITKRPTIFSLFRLSDQQQLYSTLAARTLERTTHLGNTEERNTQKRLLISNIKLAIQNMFSYALSRAISLPGDREEEQIERGRRVGPVPEFQYKDPCSGSVSSQLNTIIAHIEDLEEVTSRVSQADNTTGYNEPLATEINGCV